jgi:serine/threonine-protein kinase RsbW
VGNGAEMSAEGRSVRLKIPARPEYITLGRLALSAIAGVRPLSEETLHDLKLALTEACTNSVRHAYADGREGEVEILYELAPDRLVVEVGDEGAGFEPVDGADPDHPELEEGGLGIAIIRAVVDEVEIGPRDDGGSRLRFVKFLHE